MCSKNELDYVLNNFVVQVQELFGDNLKDVILYGSYARGEYSDSDESDIDIAIFTECPANEFYRLLDQISEATFEYNVKYDIMLSPVFQNDKDFNRMLKVLPYFQSIQREGIAVG